MPFSYTYTARNKDNPNHIVTFTIFEDQLKVNLTGLFDQVSEVLEDDEHQQTVKEIISSQTGTAIYKVIERLSGPVHICDVSPSFEDGEFTIMFWKRLAGLKFAPIVISMGNVDNSEGANQFIDTLLERQEMVEDPNVFAGPLDYWATWIAMLIGLIVLIKWPRKKKS